MFHQQPHKTNHRKNLQKPSIKRKHYQTMKLIIEGAQKGLLQRIEAGSLLKITL